jgi:hypothetical protein
MKSIVRFHWRLRKRTPWSSGGSLPAEGMSRQVSTLHVRKEKSFSYIVYIYIYVLCVCFLKGTVFCICLNRKLFVGYASKENMFCTCLKENMFLIVSQDRKMRITCCTAKRLITFTITRVRRNKKMLRKYQKKSQLKLFAMCFSLLSKTVTSVCVMSCGPL